MKYVLTTLFVCVTVWAYAQTVQFSEPYASIKSSEKYFLTNKAEQELIILKETARKDGKDLEVSVQIFDIPTMKEKKRQEHLILENCGTIRSLQLFHGKAYIFYRDVKEENFDQRLFVQEIDLGSAGLKDKAFRIIGNEKLFHYSTAFSQNGNYFLVHGAKSLANKEDGAEVGLFLFGKDFELLAEVAVDLPYDHKYNSLRDFHIDNNGVPYLLMNAYGKDDKKQKDLVKDPTQGGNSKRINFNIELLQINLEDGSYTTTPLPLQDKLPIDYYLVAGLDEKLYCAGYYTSTTSKRRGAQGVYLWQFDPTTQQASDQYHPIPLEILTQYESSSTQQWQARRALKEAAEIESIAVRGLVFDSDGSVIIQSEVSGKTIRYYSSANGFPRSYYIFFFSDIYITRLQVDEGFHWMTKIPKEQLTMRPPGSASYVYFYDHENHYYLHMDDGRNAKLGKFDPPRTYKDGEYGTLMVDAINHQTGERQRYPIIHTHKHKNDQRYRLYPFNIRHLRSIGEGKVLIEFYIERKRDVLMLLDMKG